MKKIIILLLALLSITSVAIADGLKDYSTDDLIKLQTAIIQELLDRGAMASTNVPTGEYVVGTDIPAGSYSVSTNSILVVITINDYESMYTLTPDSGVGKMTLKEGQKFETTGPITLTKYAGLQFN